MKDKDHTVSYTSIDYHSMCQKSKERIKKMQAEGIPTSHDPKPTNAEVEGKVSEKVYGSIVFL